jgi:5-methylcytosine-specific restriction enzyme subunit McrC
MLYASDLFRELHTAKIAVEDNPDQIPDLVAEILCRRVERRIQRNLSYGYRSHEAEISRVRGRIDLLKTESHRLMDHGKVACRFNELTVDTPRNRYVLMALEKLGGLVARRGLKHRCFSLAQGMKRLGVVEQLPNRGEVTVNQFGRHDATDQSMVAAAHLAFNLALPTEAVGSSLLSLPEREVTWLRRLYEKGIAGFYDVALTPLGWCIERGKILQWQISHKSHGIERILPSMRTDIVLTSPRRDCRFVIDTKFNTLTIQGWHKEETIRSGYLYQIYAYLKSQDCKSDPLSQNATGLLLHPSVGEMISEEVVIQDHEIRFKTVDLSANASEIRSQLLEAIEIKGHQKEYRSKP